MIMGIATAPVWVQVVVIVIGVVCLGAAVWARCTLKDKPIDRDYRDDL
jgi:hypothetical protein